MAFKHDTESLLRVCPDYNLGIFIPSFLALCTSSGVLLLYEILLSFSSTNHENFIITLLIQFLLVILAPITFLLGTVLLILVAAVPSDSPSGKIYSVPVNRAEKVLVSMALLCLLAEVVIGVYAVWPDAISIMWFVWWRLY